MASKDILRESAIIWVKNNTSFDASIEPLPANVELFIEKYKDVMSLRAGISSESISVLSQSFNTADIGGLLRQYARELIGEEYMLSDIKAVPYADRWV